MRLLHRLAATALAVAATLLSGAEARSQTSGYIKSIGSGCAGASNIVPALTATGSVGPGRAIQFNVTGPANMPGFIILGDQKSQSTVSPGCTLEVLVDPVWGPFYLYFTLDAAGSYSVTLPFPTTMPSVVGQHLYAQALVDDQASPQQYILSNGLDLTANVRVFVSNGIGGGNWNATATWIQIDGGFAGLGIPGFDEHYDVVFIKAGDTVRQTAAMPKTMGLYVLDEGATHRFEGGADLAAFSVEALGTLDIQGVGKPPNGVHAAPWLQVRNAADVLTVGNVEVRRNDDPDFCTILDAAPAPFDALSCTDGPGVSGQTGGGSGEDFHEYTTHPGMAAIAMDNDQNVLSNQEDYLLNELRIFNGVDSLFADTSQTLRPPYTTPTLRHWTIHGVIEEDDLFPTIRVLRHFYEPRSNTGLFARYTPSNIWGLNHVDNDWDFGDTRDHFYDALTKPLKVTRDAEMAKTFRGIGQVMHLIQDLAAPPHVRDDAHPSYRPVEEYGQFNLGSEAAMVGLPQVTATGGTKPRYNFTLKARPWWPGGWGAVPEIGHFNNFWDTNQLVFGPFAGFNLTFPPGLAELTNYNFWSLDTVFEAPHVNPSITETNLVALFPAPANGRIFYRETDYIPTPLAGGWLPVAKPPGLGRIGLTTLAAAKDFGTNAVRSFFDWMLPGTAPNRVGVGIYNETPGPGPGPASVLTEYGEKLVPLAIGYSTSFVNYFFRGKVDIRLQWDHQNQRYKLIIENNCDDHFGAGTWELYQDDLQGNRAKVLSFSPTYPGALAPAATFNATFTPHATKRGPFTLVFTGDLGSEIGTAVVGKVFDAVRVEATWDKWADADLYMYDFDGKLIYDAHRVGDYGEHDVDELGGKGPENITVHKLIPGRLQFMVNYGEDQTKERSLVAGQCVPNNPVIRDVDLPTMQCYTQTNLVITVKTFHNCATPLQTVQRTLTVPDRSMVPQNPTPKGKVGSSWHVTQIVTVNPNGTITFSQG